MEGSWNNSSWKKNMFGDIKVGWREAEKNLDDTHVKTSALEHTKNFQKDDRFRTGNICGAQFNLHQR